MFFFKDDNTNTKKSEFWLIVRLELIYGNYTIWPDTYTWVKKWNCFSWLLGRGMLSLMWLGIDSKCKAEDSIVCVCIGDLCIVGMKSWSLAGWFSAAVASSTAPHPLMPSHISCARSLTHSPSRYCLLLSHYYESDVNLFCDFCRLNIWSQRIVKFIVGKGFSLFRMQ